MKSSFPVTSTFKLDSSQKTIWIFGAGASADPPYNIPLQGNLLKHFFNMPAPGNPAAQNKFDKLREEIRRLCKRVQPGLEPQNTSLEEVFSAYELEAESSYSSLKDIQWATEAINNLKKALMCATQVYGTGQLPKWNPHNRNNTSAPYAELLEKLFPVECRDEDLKKHVLVTMNYDINLDRCLINMLGRSQGGISIDYGIDFGDFRLENAFRRPDMRSVLLLRLHGGLNWKRCNACQSVFTTIDRHANVKDTEKCKLCKCRRLDNVIVHPSYIRTYSDPILKIIWGRLHEELLNSDKWVFVGYSLPAADIHLRELLRHTLRIRNDRYKKTEVIWVGKKKAHDDKSYDELGQNYYSVFKDDVKAWDAAPGGFADFVQKIVV